MPINETGGFIRSHLTKDQKKQAEAALFGLQETFVEAHELTPDEIERMRTVIAQHDNQKGIQEFDLNNPPRKPYTHQDFPRIMYNHAKRTTRVANNAQELEAAVAAGWKKEPFPPENSEPQDPEPDGESQEMVAPKPRTGRR